MKQDDVMALELKEKRIVWEPLMKKYNCQIIAELGVRDGINFMRMIEHKPSFAVGVDVWRDTGNMGQNDLAYPQDRLDKQYHDVIEKTIEHPNVKILREFTHEAVKHFPDEFFDLVYIDADHSYAGASRDIEDWWPKVISGGFFLGDDYRSHKTRTGVRFGVRKAVWEHCEKHNVRFFKFGNNKKWGIIKP